MIKTISRFTSRDLTGRDERKVGHARRRVSVTFQITRIDYHVLFIALLYTSVTFKIVYHLRNINVIIT